MTLEESDLDRYREWDVEQLYYLLYPRIKEDFMGRGDCRAVHSEGNMMAGESVVTHVTWSGGDDTLASIKEDEYQVLVEEGDITLSTAQETGETGGLE